MQLIAEILGHKDLRSTRIHSHFNESSIKQAMSVFDKSLVSAKCQQSTASQLLHSLETIHKSGADHENEPNHTQL
jgi:hypothetical protein